ncbi:sensor histidine kinase [Neorhizobium galegae]|uniref:sensor histidine kinase n=1 Tax=Neorhizobium galegae TaxID=399 RepID=UPI00059C7A24|nr:sensor histidine kinase [Neorhizobium galegae]
MQEWAKRATHLFLVIHELATISLKYGALSVDTGTSEVSVTVTNNDIEIVWTEQGGPDVVPPDGSAVMEAGSTRRFGTTFGVTRSFDWCGHSISLVDTAPINYGTTSALCINQYVVALEEANAVRIPSRA